MDLVSTTSIHSIICFSALTFSLPHFLQPQAVVSAAFPYTVLNSNAVWRNLTGQIQVFLFILCYQRDLSVDRKSVV